MTAPVKNDSIHDVFSDELENTDETEATTEEIESPIEAEEVIEEVMAEEPKKKGKKTKIVEADEVTETEAKDLNADYVLIGNVKRNGVVHKKGTSISFEDSNFQFFNDNGFLTKK